MRPNAMGNSALKRHRKDSGIAELEDRARAPLTVLSRLRDIVPYTHPSTRRTHGGYAMVGTPTTTM